VRAAQIDVADLAARVAVVERVREAGWDSVGEIVDYENTFLLCYVRGPAGLIVELAQRLGRASG
jgi:hypothetical protein